MGDAILALFPNANVVGNYEKPKCQDEFEVYLRGVGSKRNRSEDDKLILYKKSVKGRFPEKHEVLDKLICLVLLYGDSLKLSKSSKSSILSLNSTTSLLTKDTTHTLVICLILSRNNHL